MRGEGEEGLRSKGQNFYNFKTIKIHVQSNLVITWFLGLAKLPLYNRNIAIRGQQNKVLQSVNGFKNFRMHSLQAEPLLKGTGH